MWNLMLERPGNKASVRVCLHLCRERLEKRKLCIARLWKHNNSLSRLYTMSWKIHKCHNIIYADCVYTVHVRTRTQWTLIYVKPQSMNHISLEGLYRWYAKSPTAQDTFWPIAGRPQLASYSGSSPAENQRSLGTRLGLSMYIQHVNASLKCFLNFCFTPSPPPPKMRLVIFLNQHSSSSFHEHACHILALTNYDYNNCILSKCML